MLDYLMSLLSPATNNSKLVYVYIYSSSWHATEPGVDTLQSQELTHYRARSWHATELVVDTLQSQELTHYRARSWHTTEPGVDTLQSQELTRYRARSWHATEPGVDTLPHNTTRRVQSQQQEFVKVTLAHKWWRIRDYKKKNIFQ